MQFRASGQRRRAGLSGSRYWPVVPGAVRRDGSAFEYPRELIDDDAREVRRIEMEINFFHDGLVAQPFLQARDEGPVGHRIAHRLPLAIELRPSPCRENERDECSRGIEAFSDHAG